MFKFAPQLAARKKKILEEETEKKKSEDNATCSATVRDGTTGDESPRPRKSRQNLLDPIRRWNSFHNSRDKRIKPICVTSLPYMQLRDPVPPPGLTEKSAQILGTSIASELIALSLTPRSPNRKQISSPNLLEPISNRRTRRTSSDSCPREVDIQISKELSTSDPDVQIPVQKIRSCNVPAHPRVPALRTNSELSSSLPSDVDLGDSQLPRRRFSVWYVSFYMIFIQYFILSC